MKKIVSFLIEVRREISKITWLKKDEALKATISVFIMVLISTLFFLVIDISAYKLVNFILKF
jgi:preprotein translocase subunit SecE